MPLFGFIYSYFAPIYHFGPYLALFIYIFQNIYPYLHTFSLICPYLVIFTLNCPNLTIYIYAIFTLHRYYSSETAPLSKILKQSEN